MIFSRKWIQVFAIAALAVSLSSCKSNRKATDQSTTAGAETEAPKIESTAMTFDAAGSDSGKIAGLETVHFDFDKSNLTADAKSKIQGNTEWMKSHPTVNVQVEGHCDHKGSIEYNLALGERRAKAVKNYMIGLGVSAARLSIISYGKEKPIASGDDESADAKNRRANFVPLAQ